MQKARLEANEAFKNISLGQKRKASVVERKPGMSPVAETAKNRLTRLEKCKREVQNAFGNVTLMEIGGNMKKQQDQNSMEIERPDTETKHSGIKNIQTTKKDAKSFRRDSLEKIKKGKRKSASRGTSNRRSMSRRRSSAVMQRRSSMKGKRLTKVQVAQLEALQSFGGQSLENVWKSCKEVASTCAEKTEPTIKEEAGSDIRKPVVFSEVVVAEKKNQMTTNGDCQANMEHDILTESLETGMVTGDVNNTFQQDTDMIEVAATKEKAVEFSSQPCIQHVNESTQVCKPHDKEKHTEHSNVKEAITSEVQVQNDSITSSCDQSCETHMQNTNGMSPIPEQSPYQSSPQSNEMQVGSTTPVESKPLTRLERARLEALQSFHGQALDQMMKSSSRKMAKYLTPVKHKGTNTEANPTRNTPSQTEDSYCRYYPCPKSSFYSNLRDNSFYDRDALLESSKMVVQTARSLDTPSPDCSPANGLST